MLREAEADEEHLQGRRTGSFLSSTDRRTAFLRAAARQAFESYLRVSCVFFDILATIGNLVLRKKE